MKNDSKKNYQRDNLLLNGQFIGIYGKIFKPFAINSNKKQNRSFFSLILLNIKRFIKKLFN